MPITRAAHPEALWPGVMAWFGNAYGEYAPQWTELFDKRQSTKAYEKIVETSGFGLAPQKSEGQSIAYDTDSQGIVTNFTPTVYGLGYQVTREEDEDGQYAVVSKRRSKALARSMRTTTEIIHANTFNRGFSGSYLGADGVALFSTAHPSQAGSQANKPSVDADLTEASLEDMLTLIAGATDRRGLPIRLTPKKLVVASGAQYNAVRILKSDQRVGTANNDTNAVKSMGIFRSDPAVNNYFTDLDAWFVTTDADEGLLSIWRREVEIEQDNDFDTENLKAKATMRFVNGWGDFRAVYGSQGA